MDPGLTLALMVGVPLVLLVLGGLAGRAFERAHLADLATREGSYRDVPLDDLPDHPPERVGRTALVASAVVLGSDYLTIVGAGLKSLVGGEVRRYRPLLARARREALARLLEEARALGLHGVCNARIEWVEVGAMMIAIHAYGTAYERPPAPGPGPPSEQRAA